MASEYREARSKGEGKKKLDEITIKPGAKHGHVVEHRFTPEGGMYMPRPEIHPFTEGHEMIGHLVKSLGIDKAKVIAHLQGKEKDEPGGSAKSDPKESKAEDKEDD